MRNPEPVNLFLGFDPAGRGKFGWSVCMEEREHGTLQRVATGLANNARHSVLAVIEFFENAFLEGHARVRAAGIDAPLTWNALDKGQGFRHADNVLIKVLRTFGGPANRVLPVNSLSGSVAVQGPLLALHLRAEWDLTVTESHPKVLESLLGHMTNQGRVYQMAQDLTQGLSAAPRRDHERDATLCAIAAWAAIQVPPLQGWQNLFDQDENLFSPSGIPVGYWMPIPD